MKLSTLYGIVRGHRDRAWGRQTEVFGDYEPPVGEPVGNAEWWYEQGKAEAYAAVMSEIESAACVGDQIPVGSYAEVVGEVAAHGSVVDSPTQVTGEVGIPSAAAFPVLVAGGVVRPPAATPSALSASVDLPQVTERAGDGGGCRVGSGAAARAGSSSGGDVVIASAVSHFAAFWSGGLLGVLAMALAAAAARADRGGR